MIRSLNQSSRGRMPAARFVAGLVAAGMFVLARPASAQMFGSTPRPYITLSAGYGALHDTGSHKTLPAAWLASAGLRIAPGVSAVAEMDGGYGTARVADVDVNYRSHGLLAGIRAEFARGRAAAPFVQALVGGVCHCGTTVSNGRTAIGFAAQIGGGVDVAIARNLAIRGQVDVRGVHGPTSFAQTRVAVGAVLGFYRAEQ